MRRRFSIETFQRVPDGTLVAPFVNPLDNTSGLSAAKGELPDGASVAAGIIEAGGRSAIHLLSQVAQITFVLRGAVVLKMKTPQETQPFEIDLAPEQAGVTPVGSFLQLINPDDRPCRVLYIVSPAFVYELGADGTPRYDDAQVQPFSWAELEARGWRPLRPPPGPEQRAAAVRRLTGG